MKAKEPRLMAQRPNIIPYTPHCMFRFLARSLLAAPDPNHTHDAHGTGLHEEKGARLGGRRNSSLKNGRNSMKRSSEEKGALVAEGTQVSQTVEVELKSNKR